MLNEKCLEIFVTQLNHFAYLAHSPFRWEQNFQGYSHNHSRTKTWGKLIYSKKNQKLLRIWNGRIWLIWLYTSYLTFRLLETAIYTKHLKITSFLTFILWLTVYFAGSILGACIAWKGDEICELFNCTVKFWRTNFDKCKTFFHFFKIIFSNYFSKTGLLLFCR